MPTGPVLALAAVVAVVFLRSREGTTEPTQGGDQEPGGLSRQAIGGAVGGAIGGTAAYVGGLGPIPYSLTVVAPVAIAAGAAGGALVGAAIAEHLPEPPGFATFWSRG